MPGAAPRWGRTRTTASGCRRCGRSGRRRAPLRRTSGRSSARPARPRAVGRGGCALGRSATSLTSTVRSLPRKSVRASSAALRMDSGESPPRCPGPFGAEEGDTDGAGPSTSPGSAGAEWRRRRRLARVRIDGWPASGEGDVPPRPSGASAADRRVRALEETGPAAGRRIVVAAHDSRYPPYSLRTVRPVDHVEKRRGATFSSTIRGEPRPSL